MHGIVIAAGDGSNIVFETKMTSKQNSSSVPIVAPADSAPSTKINENEAVSTNNENVNYIGNKNSKVVHKPSCSFLPSKKNRVIFSNKDEAINAGGTEDVSEVIQ